MNAMNTAIGKVISGRYKIVALAGQGGMGAAYKAIPCSDPARTVVLKLISHRNDINKVDELHRFQIEAAHLSKLFHPHIVSFHEFGILDEKLQKEGLSYYLVMDWVEGKSLKEYIASDENDLSLFFELGMQIGLALDYTHRKNIIHKDLKPSNIIIRKSRNHLRGIEAVILDFGIASLRQSMHFAGDAIESPINKIIGTPLYMSPEQTGFCDFPLDHRTDLYSLGCILFEVLVGRPPFYRGGRVQILKEHARSNPPLIANFVPNIPAEIEYIVAKLMAKNPSDRYQTGLQLFLDLKNLHNQSPLKNKRNVISSIIQSPIVDAEQEFQINTKSKKEIINIISAQKDGKKRGMILSIQSKGGGGKTQLLAEIQKELKSLNIGYISGEFLDYASSLPFHAISSAFNEFIDQLEKSPEHIASLCAEIKKRIGDEISTLCSLVPMLRKYFTSYKAQRLESLTDPKYFHKVVKVFADFLKCLGVDSNALVFMFDDLHKADDFSMKLLDIFVSNSNTQNFVLIITYHPYFLFRKPLVSEFIKKIQHLKRRYFPTVITPLSVEESKGFLSSKVDISLFNLDIDRVVQVAKGNPRYLANFCLSLFARSNFTIRGHQLLVTYDLEDVIRGAQVDSIEQCLASIEEYSSEEWSVVEALSVLGMKIRDPFALGEEYFNRRILERTLKRLENDGFISNIKVEDSGDLTQIYEFSHYHLKEVVYNHLNKAFKDQIHFIMISYLLGKFNELSLEKLSVASHHILALADNPDSISVEKRTELCNLLFQLGQIWKGSKSYFQAEIVFENALRIVDFSKDFDSKLAQQIQDALCDLWFKTQSWDSIISLGERILLESSDSQFIMKIQSAYLISAYLVQGDYQKVGQSGLAWLNERQILSKSLKYRLVFGFLKDVIFLKSENLLIQNLLQSLRTKKEVSQNNQSELLWFDLWWLQVLQELKLDSKTLNWLPFHLAAFKIANNALDEDFLIVKLLAFRAVLWSQNNQYNRAKKIMNLLIDLSYSIQNKQMIGYTNLVKCLIIDYDLNHFGDLKLHLQECLIHLSQIEQPILLPKALCLKAFMLILAGKLGDAEGLLAANLKDRRSGPVTKVLCGAFQLFIFFIRGRRDLLVVHGEQCLDYGRCLEGTDTFKIYLLVISMYIEYAKGDLHKTRELFHKICHNFSEGLSSPFLFAYERDFISLIIFSVPMIVEQEHQRKLMRQNEMSKLLKTLKAQVFHKENQERDVFYLLKAKISSDLRERTARKYFDKASKLAFVLGNDLIACFIYLWYGLNLADLSWKKQDYVRQAYKIARDRKFLVLQSYIEHLIKSEPTLYDRAILSNAFVDSSLPFNTYPTGLALKHLSYISKSYVEGSTYLHSLTKSLKLLQDSYESGLICLLLINQADHEIIFYPHQDPGESVRKELFLHLQSFAGIAESSFLPAATLPASISLVDDILDHHLNDTNLSLTQGNATETKSHSGIGQKLSPHNLNTEVTNPIAPVNELNGALDAYVPISSSSGTLGVLLVRQVPKCYSQTNIAASTKELDIYGSQLGLVIERDFYAKQTNPYSDQWLNHILESVPWLRLWAFGKVPESRVSAWSLGLAMPGEQYLIVFCSLTGGSQSERQHLSSMIWHHTLAMQVLLKSPESAPSVEFFRNQFASLLKQTPGADSLGDIVLAFSLVTKGSKKLVSGHFGNARPLVLGSNNQVKPFNDAVMSYDSGRELRFWEVLSSWEGHLPLLFCAESYRYEEVVKNYRNVSEQLQATVVTEQEEPEFSMDSIFGEDAAPSYYLAVLPDDKDGF